MAAAETGSARALSAASASAGPSSDSSAAGELRTRHRGLAIGTPMRAFLERLASVGDAEDCPWRAHLPEQCRAAPPRLPGACATEPPSLEGRANQLLQDCPIEGRVLRLSRDSSGCRRVQRALEEAVSDAQREAIAEELRGHIGEVMQCPHANHVLQKVVVTLRPHAIQFVVDELASRGFSQVARHKYGCRIVQRLLEQCPRAQTRALVDALLSEVSSIARHQYGNYVVQNLVEYRAEESRAAVLREDIVAFGSDPYAVAVLGSALAHFPRGDRAAIAEALLEERLVVSMACSRLGHHSVIRLLEALPEARRGEALAQLACEMETLQASRFGGLTLQNLEVELSSDDLAMFKQLQLPSMRSSQQQPAGRRSGRVAARAAGA